ncbi:hypothetical protein CDL15_Pgr011396 [Punica granatum]|uniref:RNase H type-1 domain-containing protein n=1 Tax=Punica granatum TaxID=22663 RepID=A0A218WFK0_PUNGR|nr:hypothetical protein CDL15_Pgr011396 [Punica granatum]
MACDWALVEHVGFGVELFCLWWGIYILFVCKSLGKSDLVRKIGVASSVSAKLWALRDGLHFANNLGITHLEVELDAKAV